MLTSNSHLLVQQNPYCLNVCLSIPHGVFSVKWEVDAGLKGGYKTKCFQFCFLVNACNVLRLQSFKLTRKKDCKNWGATMSSVECAHEMFMFLSKIYGSCFLCDNFRMSSTYYHLLFSTCLSFQLRELTNDIFYPYIFNVFLNKINQKQLVDVRILWII